MRPLGPRPDPFERALAWLAIALLAVVGAAILRGHARWGESPPLVWLHLATVAVPLGLTPFLMLRPRGTKMHRTLGWVWAGCLFATATLSFGIRGANGTLGPIHILSALVLIAVPWLLIAAVLHDVPRHRRTARALTLGALLVAGFFTLPFGRMLGSWLFA